MYLGIDVSVQAYDNMKREGNYNGSYDETFVTFIYVDQFQVTWPQLPLSARSASQPDHP